MTDDFRDSRDSGELDEPAGDAIADVETEFDGAPLDDAALDDAMLDEGQPPDDLAVQSPTGWRPPEPTGVAAVDEAVTVLTELDSLPTAEHVAYYEAAHRHLQDALADLDGA